MAGPGQGQHVREMSRDVTTSVMTSPAGWGLSDKTGATPAESGGGTPATNSPGLAVECRVELSDKCHKYNRFDRTSLSEEQSQAAEQRAGGSDWIVTWQTSLT